MYIFSLKDSIHSRIPRINGLTNRNGLAVSNLGKIPGAKASSIATTKLGKFAPSILRATGSRLRPGVLNLTAVRGKKGATFAAVPKSCSNENIKHTFAMANGEEDCEMLADETISLVGSTDHLALHDDEVALDKTIRTRIVLTPDCDKASPQIFHSTFDVSHISRPPLNSTPRGDEAPHLTFNVSTQGADNPLQLTYDIGNESPLVSCSIIYSFFSLFYPFKCFKSFIVFIISLEI